MEILATIPPPHHQTEAARIANHPYIDAARFNTGARSRLSPYHTLLLLQNILSDKPLWVDLKGRQLRITRWADLEFDHITLSHAITVDLPAQIILRNGTGEGIEIPITAVRGRHVYVDNTDLRRLIVGNGQSANIRGKNLKVDGYLTNQDKAYIEAANELGINRFMLSFVEQDSDITELTDLAPDSHIILKIESERGLNFIENFDRVNHGAASLHYMAARDDLFVNSKSPDEVIEATRFILERDRRAVVASRILTSLIRNVNPSLGDIADLTLLKEAGCSRIMLCDDLCSSDAFEDAMDCLKKVV